MHNATRAGLRVAGLMAMALFIAHCGDNDNDGGGVSPTAGTFAGVTGDGGSLVIEVGSIESITFDCDAQEISENFSPPRQVNADGSFDVRFSDDGRDFRVRGRFTDDNNADGTIDDENDACDTTFDAARQGGAVPTRTATPGPSQPTRTPTPVDGETMTPGPGETMTPGPGETATPGGPTPTPTATVSGVCPSAISFEGDATSARLDTGWTGLAHEAKVIDKGKLTVQTDCGGQPRPCGVCNLTGPIANPDAGSGTSNNHRCSDDTSTECDSENPCAAGKGECAFFFGAPLPLAAGGVATCVTNRVVGTVTGTANIETGAGASAVSLISSVFSGPEQAEPCPACTGDPTPQDGLRGGTCTAGARAGLACDVGGTSPGFDKTTSFDCPPLSGGVIAKLPIALTSSTGTVTRTLTASNPDCRDPSAAGKKCFCDVCATALNEPCASNADCPAGRVCGGRRCQGGPNNGNPCALTSECPSGACGVPTQNTAPNQCNDVVDGVACKSIGNNNGECSAGPFDLFCEPHDTFRGCTGDGDCPFPGDTCAGGKNRPCFLDNGEIGGKVIARGVADPPSGGVANPTLATLFCIGRTSSSSVNAAAGIPGLGRLLLPGTATEIP